MEKLLNISLYLETNCTEKEKGKLKILHYNASDNLLKSELADEGYFNYLGVTLKKEASKFNPDLFYEADRNIIFKNNADVLILEDASFQDLKMAFHSTAEKIICKPKNLLHSSSYLALVSYHLARGRKWELDSREMKDSIGRKGRYIIFDRKFEVEKEARHYLSPETGVEEFFRVLNGLDIKYTVLRWFEKIPFKDINEDIDLLIADEDIEKVQGLLTEKIGVLPFDLYSVSGMPGSSFRYIAYYPPGVAKKILDHREFWNGRFYVPDKRHHFLSLLYHAVYHKGEKSGIPFAEGAKADASRADHDYLKILKELAETAGIPLEEGNLSYFHRFLKKEGWAPATDTIRKLNNQHDAWLESIVRPNELNFDKKGELMVFVIRDWALENGYLEFIEDWLEKAGLNSVMSIRLDPEQKKAAAQNSRGGNWGKGPWPVSGGDPAVLLVMYDYHPIPLPREFQKKYPHVSNGRYLLKEKLRKELNSTLPPEQKTNPIHSSDDEIEALDYIAAVVPEEMARIRETIIGWDQAYETKEEVIKDLSQHKRRAKVELIKYQGKKAIKKTYKAGKERFLEREKYAYGKLSKECPFIPELLDSGENYIIIPYLEKALFSENETMKKQKLKKYKKDILEINEFFYKKGYALIDFHPGNILITKKGIRLIDFEFLYKYETLPESVDETFDLNGFPDDFREDLPYEVEAKDRRALWQEILY